MHQNDTLHKTQLEDFRKSLNSQAFYTAQVKPLLPKKALRPVPQRLFWLLVHGAILFFCIKGILNINNILSRLLISVCMGNSLAVVFMIGHEVAHGAVVKNKSLILFLSSLCFAQFGLYGKAFISWHNRMHHHSTQNPYKDPDCFGKSEKNKFGRCVANWLPGSGRLRSYTFLFWFFSFYTFFIVWAHEKVFINKGDKIESRIFSTAMYAGWLTISLVYGSTGFLYLLLIPLLISNFIVMSYLSTNHFLSPLTEHTNDPMANSLTVNTSRWLRILHLNFNYHVEHHLFPFMNPKYAPLVAKILDEKFPQKYHHIEHRRALILLYRRPKFYHDAITLKDPATGEKYPTILLDDLI